MKSVYEIKFLGSEDFDKLPENETSGSDITDSLGFYNPHTNRVFIRWTQYPELNKYLLNHEFDHLVEGEATDSDENGIRHKKKFAGGIFDFGKKGYWANALNKEGYAFINSDKKNAQNDQAQAQSSADNQLMNQQNQMNQLFANYGGFGSTQGQGGTSNFGSSVSPLSGQQASQGGLNQGLNQQSINPLANPYDRYGQQSGRIYNF